MISTRFMVPYTNINSVLNSNLGSKFPWVAVHTQHRNAGPRGGPISSKIPSSAVACTEHRSRFRLDRSGAPNLAQINFLAGHPGVLKNPLPRAVRALAATIVGSTANNNSVDRKVERAMGVSWTSSPRALHGVKV